MTHGRELMDKKVFYCLICITLFLSQNSFASNVSHANKPNDLIFSNQPQEYVLYVPAGTTVNAILSQNINSKTATTGQTVYAILTKDFRYKGNLIASAGSIISGSIVFNKKASMTGKCAQIQIRFTTIRTPYNNVIPISAVIETNDLTGIIKGEPNESTASSLQGGLGVAKAFATKGGDILIPANSRINLTFDQPITLGAT